MADIPIVLFHRSEQPYVAHALRAAKRFNPDVRIITDVDTLRYAAHATVVPIASLPDEGARNFAGVYTHLSTNKFHFEFHAIEKYFYLLELMKEQNLDRLWYIDSDVLVYSNLARVLAEICPEADLCFAMPRQRHEDLYWSASGHISFWTRPAMEAFCAFILDTYTHHQAIFEPKWTWHQQHNIPGGINDMTLIYLFQRQTGLKTCSLLQTFGDATFDNALRWGTNEYPDEYETSYSFLIGEPVKTVRFRNGVPFVRNLRLNRDIAFHILHFQGKAKNLMPLYIRSQPRLSELAGQLIWALKVFRYQEKKLPVLLREYRAHRRRSLPSADAVFRKGPDPLN